MSKNNIIGLDVGSKALKVVELVKSKGGYQLIKAGFDELGAKADDKAIVEAIKNLFKRNKITIKEVNISVEGPSVIIRNIEMPKMTEDELKNAIKFEAEKYIPYNINEVILDCQKQKETGNTMQVLLAASKKEIIDKRINILKKAGLVPWVIDVDSFALINAFNLNYPDKEATKALINLGDKTTNISILKDGLLHFTRNIALGGSNVTTLISEGLGVDYAKAEELKKNPQDKKDQVAQFSNKLYQELVNEIKSSFDYYESQYEEGVSQIYVTGGMIYSQSLNDFFKENLELKVQTWDPLNKIKKSGKVSAERLEGLRHYLPVAVGLALRKL